MRTVYVCVCVYASVCVGVSSLVSCDLHSTHRSQITTWELLFSLPYRFVRLVGPSPIFLLCFCPWKVHDYPRLLKTELEGTFALDIQTPEGTLSFPPCEHLTSEG